MPCRVDLFQGYNWYDSNDLADHMYFNTPLVTLMCEVMKLIESKGLLKECSDIVQKWYVYHKEDDLSRETTGKRLRYTEHQKELVVFIEHMREVGFDVRSGLLTEEEKQQKQEKWERQEKENKEFMDKVHQEREEELRDIIRQKEQKETTVQSSIIKTLGWEPSKEEQKKRLTVRYETISGTSKVIAVYYWNDKEIFRVDN